MPTLEQWRGFNSQPRIDDVQLVGLIQVHCGQKVLLPVTEINSQTSHISSISDDRLVVNLPVSGYKARLAGLTRTVAYGPYTAWAKESAYAMMDDRDQSILDSGGTYNGAWFTGNSAMADSPRAKKLTEYFCHSLKQFQQDAADLRQGKQPTVNLTSDGLHAYTPEMLEQKKFGVNLLDQRALDQRILELLTMSTLSDAEIKEVSRILPSNPIGERLIDELLNQQIPSTGNEFKSGVNISGIGVIPPELEDAVIASLDLDRYRLKDPSLPATLDNIDISPETLRDIIAREAERLETGNPAEYRRQETEEAKLSIALSDFGYWKQHAPDVRIRPEDNPHVDPRLFQFKWDPSKGAAPLVNLEVTPKKKPKPEVGLIGKIFSNPIVQAFVAAIPVVGAGVSMVTGLAAAEEYKDWAQSFEVPSSAFEPQYEPRPFTVFLPLDRAQIAVQHPEYLPAMFEQFRQEIANQNIRSAAAAIQQLSGKTLSNNLPSLTGNYRITIENDRHGLLGGDRWTTSGDPQISNVPPQPFGSSSGLSLAALGIGAWLLLGS